MSTPGQRTDECGCIFQERGGSATEWPHWVQVHWCNAHRTPDLQEYR